MQDAKRLDWFEAGSSGSQVLVRGRVRRFDVYAAHLEPSNLRTLRTSTLTPNHDTREPVPRFNVQCVSVYNSVLIPNA